MPRFRGLVACADCGLVYYPRRLSPLDVRQLYGDDYFNGAEYYRYLDDRAVHEQNFRGRVKDLARWLPAGKRVFEIGCAYGLFLHVARDRWQVSGCDVAPTPVEHARTELRLSVEHADFPDLALRLGEVDAFCLWDTIEHLDDPGRHLERMAEVLPPGGILALTTADIGSPLARLRGENWRQIHPPTHLWYFDRSTMRKTLERFGFNVLDIRAVGMWRGIGQIMHGLRVPGWARTRAATWGLDRRMIWLNTFDLMRVIAVRTERPVIAEQIAA